MTKEKKKKLTNEQLGITAPWMVKKLSKDIKETIVTVDRENARSIVKSYYDLQEYRKASASRIRSHVERKSTHPHEVIYWIYKQSALMELEMKKALDIYSMTSPVGRWSRQIPGIGPVLSAGLLAYIDITKAPTVGHIWSYAGLDPTAEWGEGKKRPWNADLKTLCWKIGESFIKMSGRDDDIYGKIYLERKEQEIIKNESLMFKDQADAKAKIVGKNTEAYKYYSVGKLPPAHITSRAQRYATKLFLAHWHHVAYEMHYGVAPPKPYIIEHGGHTHFIAPPFWDEGSKEALLLSAVTKE